MSSKPKITDITTNSHVPKAAAAAKAANKSAPVSTGAKSAAGAASTAGIKEAHTRVTLARQMLSVEQTKMGLVQTSAIAEVNKAKEAAERKIDAQREKIAKCERDLNEATRAYADALGK